MNRRGGKRAGSGRKTKYPLMTKLAIQLRIAEIKAEVLKKTKRAISDNTAIVTLQTRGELPKGSFKNISRYLTPAQVGKEAHDVLKTGPARAGLVSLIPKTIEIKK
jgi:hypothetical protein